MDMFPKVQVSSLPVLVWANKLHNYLFAKMGMVANAGNPNTWEAEVGGLSEVQGQPRLW